MIGWVDLGHGGDNHGAIANGIVEKDYTLMLGQKIGATAHELGLPLGLTRTSDIDLGLLQRGAMTLDGFVTSLHTNASTKPRARGLQVYYMPRNKRANRAALEFLSLLPDDLGTPKKIVDASKERGTWIQKPRNVLRAFRGDTILIELPFVTNKRDVEILNEKSFQETIAYAVVELHFRRKHGHV